MAVEHALVVDDSKSARVMLSRLLHKGGMEVDLVESAEEALDYLKYKKPDVVFMDHMMPGMDGLEATRKITQDPNTAGIPIVMYTSKEGADYLEEAKSNGAIGVLPKPAKAPQIAELLKLLDTSVSGETKERAVVATSASASVSAGLSKAQIEAIVASAVRKAVTGAMESFSQSNEASIQSAVDNSLAAVKESLSFLETKAELTDSSVNTLNIQLKETSENLNANTTESMSIEEVNATVASGISEHMNKFEQKISNMDEMLESSARQHEASAEKIEVLTDALKTTSQLDDELRNEIKALAEAAGASAANSAAEQATIKLAPDLIDRSIEERLSQVSTIYLAQVKSCKRTALYAAFLSLLAVGLALYW